MIKNHIRKTLALLFLIITFSFASPALSGTVFGPKKYARTGGEPNTYTDTFRSTGGGGVLIIRNGSAAGDNSITSGKIYLNGVEISGPNDFKKAVYYMEKSVQLNNGTNMLTVELRSSPGGYITAEVTGSVASSITLNITTLSDGTTVYGPDVSVQGTIANTSGAETGVVVNGVIASVYGGQFAANHVSLKEGQNTITVAATDANGTTAVKSITVNAAVSANYIKLRAYPESGVAPMEITLRINGTFSIVNPVLTPTGPGTVEQLVSDNPDEFKYKMTSEGMYNFTIQATSSDGNTYSDTLAITVLPLTQFDALLRVKWEALKRDLNDKDIDGAVLNFASGSQDTYRSLYNDLKPSLHNIANELNASQINFVSVNNRKAIYEILVTRNGTTYSFQLEFIQDANGIWKILKF